MSPDFSKRHLCWPETQLCLPGMQLDQQIFAHECSIASYFLPRRSAFVLQRKKISFVPDFLLSNFVVVVGTQVKHNVVENSA